MKIVSLQLKDSKQPLYIRLASAIESMLYKGELKNGEMLPPVRKLAKDLKLSISTVVSAYRLLEEKGLVYTRPGSGTYCLPLDQLKLLDSRELSPNYLQAGKEESERTDLPLINLAESSPGPEVFPVEDFKVALNYVLDTEGGKVFSYQEREGFYGLRQAVAQFAKRHLSIECSPEDVLISSGAQQAIDLVAKVLLNAKDIVLAENPTYTGARSIFSSRGARLLGIPMEKDGINLELLRYNVRRYKPVMIYTMPVYQTPTGRCMSAEKRKELLQLAEKYNFYILEEDTYSELALEGGRVFPLKSEDATDRVIYVKSFSKIIMPGIRTGFIITPRSIADALARAKYMTDISASGLVQRALAYYLDSGAWDRHIKEMLKLYKSRFDTVCKAMKALEMLGVTLEKPYGGMGLWLKLPDQVKDYEFYDSCLNNGVMIAPGSSFFVSPMQGYESYIRMTFAAAGCEDIEKGIAVAADCLRRIINRKSKKVFYI